MANVLISGGTGLIGSHLSKKLLEKGYSVTLLSRTNREDNQGIKTCLWNPVKNEIDKEAVQNADYIIHLAGISVSDARWTNERKQLIIDSRVKTAQLIFNAFDKKFDKLRTFVSASAVGYYGTITSDKIYNEEDKAATDFLGETCRLWEATADEFQHAGIRTIKLRTGVVLAKEGGAVGKLMLPAKMGIASPIGNGKQYMPWLHIDDLCGIYIKAIEDEKMIGAYNAVAPEHITNREFTRTLTKVLHKPFFFPNVPAFMMKILFGEMAEILLKGSRVSSKKITDSGYSFRFPQLIDALEDLLSH